MALIGITWGLLGHHIPQAKTQVHHGVACCHAASVHDRPGARLKTSAATHAKRENHGCIKLPKRWCAVPSSVPLEASLLHILAEQSRQPLLKLYCRLMLVLHCMTFTCRVGWQALVTNITSPDVSCEHVLKRIFTVLSTVPVRYSPLEPVQDTSRTVIAAAVGSASAFDSSRSCTTQATCT